MYFVTNTIHLSEILFFGVTKNQHRIMSGEFLLRVSTNYIDAMDDAQDIVFTPSPTHSEPDSPLGENELRDILGSLYPMGTTVEPPSTLSVGADFSSPPLGTADSISGEFPLRVSTNYMDATDDAQDIVFTPSPTRSEPASPLRENELRDMLGSLYPMGTHPSTSSVGLDSSSPPQTITTQAQDDAADLIFKKYENRVGDQHKAYHRGPLVVLKFE